MRRRILAGLAVLGTAGVVAGGVLAHASGTDSEGNLEGPAAHRAVDAALEFSGGGTANAVERDSEDGAAWEVEVTRPDGATVDVRLDENYELVAVDGDKETPSGNDASGR